PAAPLVPLREGAVRRLLLVVAGAAFAAPPSAFAHPRPVPPAQLASHWSAPPVVVLAAALAAGLFAQAVVRLRRRGRPDLAPWSRCALFAAGLALVALPVGAPRPAHARRPSALRLRHVRVRPGDRDRSPRQPRPGVRGLRGADASRLRSLAARRPAPRRGGHARGAGGDRRGGARRTSLALP